MSAYTTHRFLLVLSIDGHCRDPRCRRKLPLLVGWSLVGVLLGAASPAFAAPDGATLYAEACASCHGPDGKGAPEGTAIRVPLPDFSDCGFNTREPDSDWANVVHHGGPAAGLSSQMPTYADALTADEVMAILSHMRTFCRDAGWPRGELNFRRPLFTSKAFPENEAVVLQEFTKGPGGTAQWLTKLQGEMRVGRRGQVELALPLQIDDPAEGPTTGGVGDVALSYKHVLYASLPRLTIASAALELVLPSGDRDRGLGDGTVSFEPSLLAGTGALAPVILQGQLQVAAPIDEERADRGLSYRLAASYPLGPLRRDWWPTLELEADQNVTSGADTFFLTPQIYKAIRKRGHVAMAVGVQMPVGGHQPFDYRIVGFLLWEYLDGGLWW